MPLSESLSFHIKKATSYLRTIHFLTEAMQFDLVHAFYIAQSVAITVFMYGRQVFNSIDFCDVFIIPKIKSGRCLRRGAVSRAVGSAMSYAMLAAPI